MKTELVTQFYNECDAEMAALMPTFALYKQNPFPGPGRMYAESTSRPAFFVYFQAHDRRDAFTVEISWSLGGVPVVHPGAYQIPRDWADIGVFRTDTNVEEFCFRLPRLWVKPKYDPWWEFAPRVPYLKQLGVPSSKVEMLSVIADQQLGDAGKCKQLVANAVQNILQFGIPYMHDIRARTAAKGA